MASRGDESDFGLVGRWIDILWPKQIFLIFRVFNNLVPRILSYPYE